MAITKPSRGMLDTGISDSSDATTLSFDSSENALFHGHVDLSDNKKIRLGIHDDLEIYHSTHNYIKGVNASADLIIQNEHIALHSSAGQNMLHADSGGALTLFHAGNSKLATSSDGIDVTGHIDSATITTTGNVTIGGNLTVNGTTTSVNSTTMEVADLNIQVAKNATTSAATNGAGLTFGAWSSGTIPRFEWSHSDQRFFANKPITANLVGNVTGNVSGTAATVTAAAQTNITSLGTLTSVSISGVLAANGYIDLNNSGNRGKIGYNSNHVYIGSSSSVGSIIFKNNISSGGAPHTDGDTLVTMADAGMTVAGNLVVDGGTTLGNADTDVVTVPGPLAVDTDTLYVDVTNDRVSINSGTSPTEALHVTGNIKATGTFSAGTSLSTFHDRIKILNGSAQLNIGQWDTANHRIEGDATRPMFITSYHSGGITLGSSGATKFNVNNSGATVTGTLVVDGDADSGLILGNAGTNANKIYAIAGDELYIGANNGYALRFRNDGTNNVLFDNNSNVGIGQLTSAPDSKLHVFSGVSSTSDWGNLGIISDFPINNAGRIYTAYLLQDSQSIKSAAIGHSYDGTGYKMHFGTASSTSSGISNTALTINRVGNVGIGATSPETLLEIRADTASGSYGAYPALTIRNDNAAGYGAIHFNEGSTQRARVEVGNNSGSPYLGLYTTSGASGITIKSGNVGIGTAAPNAGLEVLKAGGGKIRISETAARYVEIIGYAEGTANGSTMAFQTIQAGTSTSTERMRITSDGNVGIGTTDFPSGMASSSYKQLKIGGTTLSSSGSGNGSAFFINQNAYIGAGNDHKFDSGHKASSIGMGSGDINFYTHDGSGASADATWTKANRMHITEAGNVGINCTAPEEKLVVDGGVKIANSNKRLYFGTEGSTSHRALEGSVDGNVIQVGEGYTNVLLGSASAKVGIRQTSPDAMLHIDGATSSIAGLIIEGNTSGDVISLQMKAKANNGTLSYHGLTANPGADQDDNTISLGNGGGNGVVVDHQNVATARYLKAYGGGTYSYDVGGSYLGANGADFGTHAIFRTPSVSSPSSGAASTQFLTVYSSGHWGEYPVCRFKVYSTYFTGGYREYLFRQVGGTSYINEVPTHYNTGTAWGATPASITKGNTTSTGGSHSGQTVYRTALTLNSGGAYQRDYVVTEIMFGANRYYSSANTQAQIDALSNLGGKYHFKTISLAEGRGYFAS